MKRRTGVAARLHLTQTHAPRRMLLMMDGVFFFFFFLEMRLTRLDFAGAVPLLQMRF